MPPRLHSLPSGLCICLNPNCVIPYGECHCGCGEKTNIVKVNVRTRGLLAGYPNRFFNRHQTAPMSRKPPRPTIVQPMNQDVRIVALTQNQTAEIDAKNLERVATFNWAANFMPKLSIFYASRNATKAELDRGCPKRIHMHDFILNVPRGVRVDHRDGNTLRNLESNLRVVTQSQNSMNHRRFANNTSGHTGIRFYLNAWEVRIWFNNKSIYLGRYIELEEAIAVRHAKELELFGEFSRIQRDEEARLDTSPECTADHQLFPAAAG